MDSSDTIQTSYIETVQTILSEGANNFVANTKKEIAMVTFVGTMIIESMPQLPEVCEEAARNFSYYDVIQDPDTIPYGTGGFALNLFYGIGSLALVTLSKIRNRLS